MDRSSSSVRAVVSSPDGRGEPSRARRWGATKTWKVTKAEAGLPGQAEDRELRAVGHPEMAEGHRAAGAHPGPPEIEAKAELENRALEQVLLPHRRASGGHERIEARQRFDSPGQSVAIIRHDPEIDGERRRPPTPPQRSSPGFVSGTPRPEITRSKSSVPTSSSPLESTPTRGRRKTFTRAHPLPRITRQRPRMHHRAHGNRQVLLRACPCPRHARVCRGRRDDGRPRCPAPPRHRCVRPGSPNRSRPEGVLPS